MNRGTKSNGVLLFFVLIFTGLVLGRIQTSYRSNGKVDPLSNLLQKLILPTAGMLKQGGDWTHDFFLGVSHGAQLSAENRQLKSQVQALSMYSSTISNLRGELLNSQELLKLKSDVPAGYVPAQIIGAFNYENRITLNVGSQDGISPSMPVVAGAGLMGVVQTVSGTTCEVELISSPSIKIGAITERNPPAAGLIHGEDASTLIIDFTDPKAPIAVGDNIFTTGFSNYIPRGIPIGRVFKIDDNPDFGIRRAFVYPWVTLGSAKDVMVVK